MQKYTAAKIGLLYRCLCIKWIFFYFGKLYFLFFSFFFFVVLFFVIVQSSGIETLVEELCSRLKDLQSKQGKE